MDTSAADASLPAAADYATPPIHPKLSLAHILNSTLDSNRYATTNRRQQLQPQTADPHHLPLESSAAATHGSNAVRTLDSSSVVLPRTSHHARLRRQQKQQHQHSHRSSVTSHSLTQLRTRNRALSNLSNASFPPSTVSNPARLQSRRPSTRAAASGSTGDENKINPAARSTKNAGLALRSKNVRQLLSDSLLISSLSLLLSPTDQRSYIGRFKPERWKARHLDCDCSFKKKSPGGFF